MKSPRHTDIIRIRQGGGPKEEAGGQEGEEGARGGRPAKSRRQEGEGRKREKRRRGTAGARMALAKAAENRYRPSAYGRIVRSLR